jgi:CobQ-like glutamine amidotransferase family enzyme
MYPDILNLHGERGNMFALRRFASDFGLEFEVKRVSRLGDEIPFDGADLMVIGAGELASAEPVISALSEQCAGLSTFLERGGKILCTGTSGAILARETMRTDGTIITGLGLLAMTCRERTAPKSDDLIFKVEGCKEEIAGSQVQMIDIELDPSQEPLGTLTYGYGNNDKGTEGAKTANIIFTNTIGPVLVKNPWLTAYLTNTTPDYTKWETELKSLESVKTYNTTKLNSKH